MDATEHRLEELGITLPPSPPATASFDSVVAVENLVFVSGIGPFDNGELTFLGKIGDTLDIEAGKEAARLVTLNLLATLREELGSLERVRRFVKLVVFVNSAPDFTDQHVVANSASDLLIEVFGVDRGRHARSAVGMAALPFGISVEIEAVVSVRNGGTGAYDHEVS